MLTGAAGPPHQHKSLTIKSVFPVVPLVFLSPPLRDCSFVELQSVFPLVPLFFLSPPLHDCQCWPQAHSELDLKTNLWSCQLKLFSLKGFAKFLNLSSLRRLFKSNIYIQNRMNDSRFIDLTWLYLLLLPKNCSQTCGLTVFNSSWSSGLQSVLHFSPLWFWKCMKSIRHSIDAKCKVYLFG